jgi:MscS family membrane protein
MGDTLGTVEDIGLRSTRIRTLDRSVISVPNGHIANMTLENLTSRDKFWFHPSLSLRHGTTSLEVQAVLDGVRSLLQGSQHINPESVRVRFVRFGLSSLDVEAFAYVLARDWNQFLEIQEGLLLRIMAFIESAGVQIALPSQAIFVATASTSTDGRVEGLLKAPAPDKKTSDQAVAKSA